MFRISGHIRPYPWGSREAIAHLRGEEPSSTPEAELWFGSHPDGASAIHDCPDYQDLYSFLSAHPEQLGSLNERYGRLPFLLKILAADKPLSLQAHPTKTQAEEGFLREEKMGVDRHAPHRNYKDDNHKPELLVALTPFRAMAGFASLERTEKILALMGIPSQYRDLLQGEDGLRTLFMTWISLPSDEIQELLSIVKSHCQELLSTSHKDGAQAVSSPYEHRLAQNILHLMDEYPKDPGVLCSLLLNHVFLEPGQAIYLSAGNLHAYIRGLGVEIMANSDNVLRGGLTGKYVDVPELMKVLDFIPLDNPVQDCLSDGRYEVPIQEFALRYLNGMVDKSTTDSAPETNEVQRETQSSQEELVGPTIVLCTQGQTRISQEGQSIELHPTEACWIGAGEKVEIDYSQSRIFIATASS